MTGAERTRARVMAVVTAYPGLHVRELARQLDTSVALVEYHLRSLEEQGAVELVNDQRFVRVFAAKGTRKVPPSDRPAVQALRNATGLEVVLALLEVEAPLAHGALAERTGLAKSTLSFHLRKLESAGLVAQSEAGYQVPDPRRVLRLLLEYRPTPDLLDRFARVWNELYS